jgi:PIN domain nuclease of toxin-antitoxin system
MKYLLDTHILLWSFFEPEKLSENTRSVLLDDNNDIYYSPVNLWEISIKYGLKKLSIEGLTPEEFYSELEKSYYICTKIENITLITNYRLPVYHKDPFDRFLVWEAIRNNFILISVDKTLTQYRKEGLKIIR